MIRRIIKINEEKCTGCGLCTDACHEGAIKIINGKAKLIRDDYCDGLGDCLPACPENAISFEEREALPYNEKAVLLAKKQEKPAAVRELPHRSSKPRQIPYNLPLFPASYPNGLSKSNLCPSMRLILKMQIFLLRLTAQHMPTVIFMVILLKTISR